MPRSSGFRVSRRYGQREVLHAENLSVRRLHRPYGSGISLDDEVDREMQRQLMVYKEESGRINDVAGELYVLLLSIR